MFSRRVFLATASLSTAVLASATVLKANADSDTKLDYPIPKVAAPPPKREELIKKLHQASGETPDDVYDILVIGGGATGTGVAVDAASRGLKVALLERDDFLVGHPRARPSWSTVVSVTLKKPFGTWTTHNMNLFVRPSMSARFSLILHHTYRLRCPL